MSGATWTTIESDPGVFTELIREVGCVDVQVEEIYSLDDASLAELAPVFGLIFLFKYTGERNTRPVTHDASPTLFYATQVINNACATQAILSVLMNASGIDLGPELTQFKSFTSDFPPDLKGEAITNSDRMRSVHNSFARADAISVDEKPVGKPEDLFHFISYVPYEGVLFELDGLAGGPIALGECTNEDWLQKVRPVIEERMQRYQTQSSQEIRFNLMAVIRDRRAQCRERVAQLDAQLVSSDSDVETLLLRKEELLQTIVEEEMKMARYAKENARRKHNFIGLIFELLQIMAERNVLISQPSPVHGGS